MLPTQPMWHPHTHGILTRQCPMLIQFMRQGRSHGDPAMGVFELKQFLFTITG